MVAVASKADGVMALGATDLDATAYPAASQTMTASAVARTLSEERMFDPSSRAVFTFQWCSS